jgi:hypothetical protein
MYFMFIIETYRLSNNINIAVDGYKRNESCEVPPLDGISFMNPHPSHTTARTNIHPPLHAFFHRSST